MKKVIIVAPQFPPCNLTAVHRSRYLAAHLKKFGWEPIVLTIESQYYKEKLDYELEKLIPPDLKVIRKKAFKPTKLIGDASIRCFLWHWLELRRLAKNKKVDFIFISLLPAYSTLLGRLIYEEFRIPYAIDYQDPWVLYSKEKEAAFSKKWFSARLANILEPIAVKKVSLLVSVSEPYLRGVISRNPHLQKVKKVIAPIGFESSDYEKIKYLNKKPYIFKKDEHAFNFVYAGAMLPHAYSVLNTFFKGLKKLEKENIELFRKIRIYFIGTGKSADDMKGFNVKPVAAEFGLYNTTVFEHPARIPYCDGLIHLKEADAILVLGSTEEHYTPSKIFEAAFSKNPILAILNERSSAVNFIKESNAGRVVTFQDERGLDNIVRKVSEEIMQIMTKAFYTENVNYSYFDKFSAEFFSQKLAKVLNEIIDQK